jgi:hypothetical protein
MKNLLLISALIISMCAWPVCVQGQGGIMSAPILEFLTESQTAELIAGFAEQINQFENMIEKAKKQIDEVMKVKDELQKTYNFYERNYEKLKKVVEGIKDFNLEGFIYFAEQKLDRSLNPADYMLKINNEEYNKFRKSISYNPGSNVSARAKYSYRYLTDLNPADALGDLLYWVTAKNENEIKNQLLSMESSRVVDSMALVAIDRLLHDSTLVMSDGERLQTLLLAQKILADNAANRTNELSSIEDELNRRIIEAKAIERNHNTANSIYAYNNVITARWNTNKGFSLSKYAKKRTKKAKPVIIDTGVRFTR